MASEQARRPHWRWSRIGVVALCIALAGAALTVCRPHPIGPARTFGKYQGKAKTTAKSVLSSVENARLVAATAAKDHAIGPYVSVMLSESEEGASGAVDTFDSIQPPNSKADRLRSQYDDVMSTAVDHLSTLRVAAHRGQLKELGDIARPLDDDAEQLKKLAGED